MNTEMKDQPGIHPIASVVISVLGAHNLTLATCESLTGGGIGEALTSVPGSSAVFRGGLITYASDLKSSLAGVEKEWIDSHGVINEMTALQMAAGAARICGAQLAVAVTGVAGPDWEDGEAPGVVCMAVYREGGKSVSCRLQLIGDRADVRRETVNQALTLVLKYLAKN